MDKQQQEKVIGHLLRSLFEEIDFEWQNITNYFKMEKIKNNDKGSNMLEWEYNHDGTWEAYSKLHDNGNSFIWKISVTPKGLFTNRGTSEELTNKIQDFKSFLEAANWCEEAEVIIVNNMLNIYKH